MTDQNNDRIIIPPAGDELSDLQARHDPLVGALVVLTRLYQRPMTAEALTAGLPLNDQPLTPELMIRAAERGMV
jgi:ATP-binding cassette subfamily C protein LapB